jgi:hypothetical protein
MTHDNIYTFEEILGELLKNNDFHSFDQIIRSEDDTTYYIIRTSEEATEILLNPQINLTTPTTSYIILSDILIKCPDFDKNINCDGWIFSKSLTFNGIIFKNEVNFSNCIFLNKIDFFNVTFMSKVNFDYSTVNIADFGDVKFCQSISFNRFFVRDRLNIRYCILESSFYLQYRYPYFNPLKSDLRPIFNFSYSKFHKFFGLDTKSCSDTPLKIKAKLQIKPLHHKSLRKKLKDSFDKRIWHNILNLKRATPIIVMEKTIFLDDIDIDYDELFRYDFKNLLFDQKSKIQF